MSKGNLTKRIKQAAIAVGGVFVFVMWLRGRDGDEPGASSAVESASAVVGDVAPWALGLGGMAAVVTGLWWWQRRSTPAAVIRRRTRRANRTGGLATTWQIWRRGGRGMVITKAARVRPSLAALPWWRRPFVSPTEAASVLATVRTPVGPLKMYSTHEEWELTLAPPRAGKTGKAAYDVITAPGAVITTSTRVDIVTKTIAMLDPARPVLVLNPDGLGGGHLPSTLQVDLLVDCTDPTVAMTRAAAMCAGVKGQQIGAGETSFWQGQAVRILSLLLEAAALSKQPITIVPRWIAGHESRHVQDEVSEILSGSVAPAQALNSWNQFTNTNSSTATSTTTTITSATQWLRSPEAAKLATPDPGQGFNVAEFLRDRGVLYLLAQDRDHGSIAPFYSAFVGYIVDEAVKIASASPGGRLDPALSLVLDELSATCCLPIDKHSAILGGSGIFGRLFAQNLDQLREKWGVGGGNVIWANCTSKIFMGGCDNPDDLDWLSALVGSITVPKLDVNGKRTGETVTRQAMPPERIRDMEDGEAVILRGRMAATIGTVPAVWRMRGWRERPLIPDPRAALEAAAPRKAITSGPEAETTEGEK